MINLSGTIHNYFSDLALLVFDLEERNLSWSKFCKLIKKWCVLTGTDLEFRGQVVETPLAGSSHSGKCNLGLGILFSSISDLTIFEMILDVPSRSTSDTTPR